MKEKRLEIMSSNCAFVLTEYEGSDLKDLSLDYIERSPDGYYSDSETSLDVCEHDAKKIVELLIEAYPSIKVS